MVDLERNKDVFLNFGLICYGPLREIEKLQMLINQECRNLRIVYQTVTAKRLFLVKRNPRSDRNMEVGRWERKV